MIHHPGRQVRLASIRAGLAARGWRDRPRRLAAPVPAFARSTAACATDRAMQTNNMAELITAAKYWRRWSNPSWIVCKFNNGDLNQVTWEQRVMEGDPKFEASQQISDGAAGQLHGSASGASWRGACNGAG
jgi:pyruvate dehydrogenase (quinone)